MPDIKESVGEGGLNQPHDVALVQAMLRVVKNAKGQPYLGGNYDGSYGGVTKTAILAFQKDHKTAATPAAPAPPVLKAPAPGAKTGGGLGGTLGAAVGAAVGAAAAALAGALLDKAGHVKAKGPTIQKLNDMLPADAKDIRIIEGTKTVYWPGLAPDADKHAKAIAGDTELEAGFRAVVAQLVRTMFERHKIVLSLTNSGGRRTFQKQFELRTQPKPPTGAGPGESNHNFGQAVDIGYQGFKWMKGDGRPETDTWWLNDLAKVSGAKSNEMWAARNKIAVDELGLHPSALKGDLIHLQKFSDAKVSMRRSLAHLLTTVGTMKWEEGYKCDLGGGKTMFPVGSAVDIWKGAASVSAAELAAAKGVPVTSIKEADLKAMREKLRADFDLAQANWEKWEAK